MKIDMHCHVKEGSPDSKVSFCLLYTSHSRKDMDQTFRFSGFGNDVLDAVIFSKAVYKRQLYGSACCRFDDDVRYRKHRWKDVLYSGL